MTGHPGSLGIGGGKEFNLEGVEDLEVPVPVVHGQEGGTVLRQGDVEVLILSTAAHGLLRRGAALDARQEDLARGNVGFGDTDPFGGVVAVHLDAAQIRPLRQLPLELGYTGQFRFRRVGHQLDVNLEDGMLSLRVGDLAGHRDVETDVGCDEDAVVVLRLADDAVRDALRHTTRGVCLLWSRDLDRQFRTVDGCFRGHVCRVPEVGLDLHRVVDGPTRYLDRLR